MKKLRASRALFLRNSQASPWYSLVPDFVATLTIPPSAPPYDELSLCDWTLNSWRPSIIGVVPTMPMKTCPSLNPSSRKKLQRLHCPFTEGKVKEPIVLPPHWPPPPAF